VATPHQVTVGSLVYTVVDDCTTTYWAIITGAVVDEILGDLYAPGISVVTGRADLPAKSTENGLFAITGYPQQSFPHHDTMLYSVTFTISAPGFRDLKFTQGIGIGVPFPVVITSPIPLRRLPVRVQGRVVNDLTRAPLAGVTVTTVDDPVTPPAVHAMALRTPLYADHPSTPPVPVQLAGLTPLGTSALAEDVKAGDNIVNLANLTGLALGSLVQLTSPGNVLVEYGVVIGLNPGAPNQAVLQSPLNRSYSKNGPVANFFSAGTTGGVAHLVKDANAGDGVLVADQLLSGTTLVVDSGPAAEYHEIGAVSDTDGYYSFDGVGSVPEIFLFAKQGALQQTAAWFIEYDQAVNIVDLRLS